MNLEHPPFINLPRVYAAISDYPGNMTDRQVVAFIAQFANQHGEAWPSERYTAKCLNMEQDDVSDSVKRAARKISVFTITREKKGNDKHPRNVYHFDRCCVRSTPDPLSKRYADAVKKKKQAAEMASQQAATPQAAQAVTMTPAQAIPAAPAVQLTTQDTTPTTQAAPSDTTPTPQAAQTASASPTPSQAREARQQRGGGCDSFGGVLAGLSPTASAPVQAVKDDYSQQVPRGGWSQALSEHEAQQAAQAVPTIQAAQIVQPQPVQAAAAAMAPTDPAKQRERKAQASAELQPLRERLSQQAPAPMTDTTTAASQQAQTIQQPQATPAMQQEAAAAWSTQLNDARAQAAQDVTQMASQPTQWTADEWYEWDTWPEAATGDEWNATAPEQTAPAIQQPTPQAQADAWAEAPTVASQWTGDEWYEWDTWTADEWAAWAQLDEPAA